jgi:hypothetical protein
VPNIVRKYALWIDQESTFGTDPDTDGSDYLAVPVDGVPTFPTGGAASLEQELGINRNRITSDVAGPDGGEFSFSVSMIGLAAAAGNGSSPGADDWLDYLLNSFLGTKATFAGDDVTAATSSDVSITDDTLSAEDVFLTVATGATAGQWRHTTSSSSAYAINRNWDTTPTAGPPADIVYGAKIYGNAEADGSSLAAAWQIDDKIYEYLGCRVTAFSIQGEAGGKITANVTMRFDRVASRDAAAESPARKGSLPTIDGFDPAPTVAQLSSVAWNGSAVAVKSFGIEFNIDAQDNMSTAGTNGRSDIEVLSVNPTITINPAFDQTFETNFDAKTQGTIEIQMGKGLLSGSVVNSCFFYAQAAQITEVRTAPDGNKHRQEITIKVIDAGIRSGTDVYKYFRFARS